MPNTLPSFTGQTLTLYERVSVFDQGEAPWVHASSLIIYLKENKAF